MEAETVKNNKKKFLVAENHKYNKIEGINSVQSSLKSHPMWVTLYLDIIRGKNDAGTKQEMFTK